MGFFNTRSRALRRKIKDLQAELRDAEREGDYVKTSGLFFANLDDMGDATMMVFGSGAQHAKDEDEVVRAFLDRNGFTVEELKLDRSRTKLDAVEIVPPNELLMWIGSQLQGDGYRVVDDGDDERAPELERKLLPISTVARASALLFAEKVKKIIAGTPLKMTKEGNRLLSWMPLLIEKIGELVDAESLAILRPVFEEAFDQFYAQTGRVRRERPADPPSSERIDRLPRADPGAEDADERPPVASHSEPAAENRPRPATAGAAVTPLKAAAAGREDQIAKLTHSEQIAKVQAAMYKTLVRSIPGRCVKNTEALLHHVNRLFRASATCVLAKTAVGKWSIFAQAGMALTWGDGAGGKGFPVSQTIIRECLQRKIVVVDNPSGARDPSESMVAFNIATTAAAPIQLNDDPIAVLYLDRRAGIANFTQDDCDTLRKIATIFEEFPDLTLGVG